MTTQPLNYNQAVAKSLVALATALKFPKPLTGDLLSIWVAALTLRGIAAEEVQATCVHFVAYDDRERKDFPTPAEFIERALVLRRRKEIDRIRQFVPALDANGNEIYCDPDKVVDGRYIGKAALPPPPNEPTSEQAPETKSGMFQLQDALLSAKETLRPIGGEKPCADCKI